MSTWTESFDEFEQRTVTVTVEGVEYEDQGRELADLYRSASPGLYTDGDVSIDVEVSVDDINVEANEDGVWEDDDE